VSKEDLFRQADFITIHVVLSQRSRGIVGAKEFGLMKPSAYIINTSRDPSSTKRRCSRRCGREEDRRCRPRRVRYRAAANRSSPAQARQCRAHAAPRYVSVQNYQAYFAGVVDDIRGFLDGKPVRVME